MCGQASSSEVGWTTSFGASTFSSPLFLQKRKQNDARQAMQAARARIPAMMPTHAVVGSVPPTAVGAEEPCSSQTRLYNQLEQHSIKYVGAAFPDLLHQPLAAVEQASWLAVNPDGLSVLMHIVVICTEDVTAVELDVILVVVVIRVVSTFGMVVFCTGRGGSGAGEGTTIAGTVKLDGKVPSCIAACTCIATN